MSAEHQTLLLVEQALEGLDVQERDEARAELVRAGSAAAIERVCLALCAPLDLTRRRAARLLSELPPQRALPPLSALLSELFSAQERWREARHTLTLAARLITTLSEQESELLTPLCAHPHPKVRQAALSPITPAHTLCELTSDPHEKVAGRAAALCLKRGLKPEQAELERAVERHPEVEALTRLLASAYPHAEALSEAARQGRPLALRYCQAPHALLEGLERSLKALEMLEKERGLDHEACLERAVSAALGVGRASHKSDAPSELLSALARLSVHAHPALRSVSARYLPLDHPSREALGRDPHTGVRWLALTAREGRFTPQALEARLGPHARLTSPSARPPYGLRPYDELPEVPRVRAALALCHARFDVNVGVALRSAEAAGLEALFTVGERAMSLSPTRGAELAIPLTQLPDPASLISRARAEGYQLVAVQQTPDSQPYHLASYPPNPLFVLGSEDAGLPDELRLAADLVVEIPLYGLIDSLNVATAATCVLMHWRVHHGGV